MPCGAPCTRLPCDKRCSSLLKCGHRCPCVCGEVCAPQRWCAECGTKDDEVADLLEGKSYSEIQLDESLQALIILPCGHGYTAETMDGLFELNRGYTQTLVPAAVAATAASTGSGNSTTATSATCGGSSSATTAAVAAAAEPVAVWTGTRPLDGQWSLKRCPQCKAPVHGVNRYSRVQRRAELQALEQKFLLSCQSRVQGLQQAAEAAAAARTAAARAANKPPVLKDYQQLVAYVKTSSPTRLVFEVCQHTHQQQQQQQQHQQQQSCDLEVPAPPVAPLLDALLAAGQFCVESAPTVATSRAAHSAGEKWLFEAIAVADSTLSLRKGGRARLLLVRLLINAAKARQRLGTSTSTGSSSDGSSAAAAAAATAATAVQRDDSWRTIAKGLLDWVLLHTADVVVALQDEAKQVQRLLDDRLSLSELKAIMEEMAKTEGGSPGGWGGAGHWFTCANGHPYYIGT
eukprot:15778-Heterococcus_DN1.PRE.3